MKLLPVVILAGGLGTRIQEVAQGKPKALVEVLGKPFLYWKLNELIHQGVSKIYILGHVGADQIIDFLERFEAGDAQISFIDDGDEPKGTAGAIKAAISQLPERFILTYGDNLLPQKIEEFVLTYQAAGKPNLLVITNTISSEENPNTAIDGSLVTSYSKVPINGVELNYLEYGYSIWSSKTFTELPERTTPLDMASVIGSSAQKKTLSAFVTSSPYYEIGTPNGLKRAQEWLASVATH